MQEAVVLFALYRCRRGQCGSVSALVKLWKEKTVLSRSLTLPSHPLALPVTVSDGHHVACTDCVVERNALGDFVPFGDRWLISAVARAQN